MVVGVSDTHNESGWLRRAFEDEGSGWWWGVDEEAMEDVLYKKVKCWARRVERVPDDLCFHAYQVTGLGASSLSWDIRGRVSGQESNLEVDWERTADLGMQTLEWPRLSKQQVSTEW